MTIGYAHNRFTFQLMENQLNYQSLKKSTIWHNRLINNWIKDRKLKNPILSLFNGGKLNFEIKRIDLYSKMYRNYLQIDWNNRPILTGFYLLTDYEKISTIMSGLPSLVSGISSAIYFSINIPENKKWGFPTCIHTINEELNG